MTLTRCRPPSSFLNKGIWSISAAGKEAIFDYYRRGVHRATDDGLATHGLLDGSGQVILRLRHEHVRLSPLGVSEFLAEQTPPVAQQTFPPGGFFNGILAAAVAGTPYVSGSTVAGAAAAAAGGGGGSFSPPYPLELRFPSADVDISRSVADILRERPFNEQVRRMVGLGFVDIGHLRALDANYDVIMVSSDSDSDDSTGSGGSSSGSRRRTRQRVERVEPPRHDALPCGRQCCGPDASMDPQYSYLFGAAEIGLLDVGEPAFVCNNGHIIGAAALNGIFQSGESSSWLRLFCLPACLSVCLSVLLCSRTATAA